MGKASSGAMLDIDWHRLLINLKRTGMSVAAISAETKISEGKLTHIRIGNAYRLDLNEAIALLDLHYDRAFDQHQSLRKA